MDLTDFQNESMNGAIYGAQSTTAPLTYSVLALCGEAGELANKLKKSLRAGTAPDPAVLADELGDVLWYVAAVAHDLGMDLNQIALMNLDKLAARRAEKVIIG
jgi:NTP pyrophosphatase (non-canonical NTP hydrolase)